MKKIILFLSLLFLPIVLFCQNDEFRTWRVNSQASLNFNSQQSDFAVDKTNTKLSPGLQLGHRFNEKFEMEIGIGFSRRYDHRSFITCTFCNVIGGFFGDEFIGDFDFELTYLDLSVMGNYYFKRSNKFDIFAATGLSYSLLKTKELRQFTGQISRYPNILVNPVLGLGFVFHLSDLLELRYQSNYLLGVSKVVKTDDSNKTNTVSINLGIGFHF